MRGPLVIVGDALLDIDVEGSASRLTPDAPVPVLDDPVEKPRPGGAGLAAAMAAHDGHEVVLVTALGSDQAGSRVEELLSGVRVVRLPYDGPTAVKQRIRAGGQSLLRLDSGTRPGRISGLPDEVPEILRKAGALLVADYGRGVTAVPALRELLTALPKSIPVTWDPHPRGTQPVPGTRLVTPNRSEAATFADRLEIQVPERAGDLATVNKRAEGLVAAWQARAALPTHRGQDLFHRSPDRRSSSRHPAGVIRCFRFFFFPERDWHG